MDVITRPIMNDGWSRSPDTLRPPRRRNSEMANLQRTGRIFTGRPYERSPRPQRPNEASTFFAALIGWPIPTHGSFPCPTGQEERLTTLKKCSTTEQWVMDYSIHKYFCCTGGPSDLHRSLFDQQQHPLTDIPLLLAFYNLL